MGSHSKQRVTPVSGRGTSRITITSRMCLGNFRSISSYPCTALSCFESPGRVTRLFFDDALKMTRSIFRERSSAQTFSLNFSQPDRSFLFEARSEIEKGQEPFIIWRSCSFRSFASSSNAALQWPACESPTIAVPVFCDDESCLPIVGHVLVYRDATHLTATFSKTLAPLFARHLEDLKTSFGG